MKQSCLRFVLAALSVLWIAGCVTSPSRKKATPPPATPAPTQRTSYWNVAGLEGPPKIVVRLGEQRAYFYKGDKLAGEANISSGRRGFETPTGVYRVIEKDADHVSNLYGDFVNEAGEVVKSNVDVTKDTPPEGTTFRGSKMPYFLRFHRGYGLHAGRLPGRRASHGCVRLPRFMAQHFYQNATYGTPIIVKE